jgi:hypothetical protein
MVDSNRSISSGPMPDVYYVELRHHPVEWSNGAAPEVYTFRCVGRTWGSTRWVVHAVWANKEKPTLTTSRAFSMATLRQLISNELAHQLHREIPQWDNDLLAWEEK